MIVVGFCALLAIVAFNRFGTTLHRALQSEARHIHGEGMPNAADILGGLGGLTDPDGFCDLASGLCVPGSGFCFEKGTLVATETGDRPIETILPGDRVWSRNMETGEVALRPAVRTWVKQSARVIEVELRSDSLMSERIRVTAGHRFWVEGQGWVRADGLAADTLWSTDAAVSATALSLTEETTTVYNLEVSGFHTYFVGAARALVHNQTAGNDPNNCPPPGGGLLPPGTNPPNAIPRDDDDPLELECGDLATYGELSAQQPASGTSLDRDHVPSNGALRKRAEMLVFGEPLTSSEERTMRQSAAFRKFERLVQNAGLTIAIPPEAHRALSQTYGGRNTNQRQTDDARDLAAAARRNMDAIRAGLGNYSADCVAAYEAAAGRVAAMTNDDYDRLISDSLSGLTSEELEELQDAFDAL